MTRDTLMLSDTAMVLLRQYVDAWQDSETFDDAFRSEVAARRTHKETFSVFTEQEQLSRVADCAIIYDQLISEIWYLWHYPDIPIVRHLDWHLVLDLTLMNRVADCFALPLTEIPPAMREWRGGKGFGQALYDAYEAHVIKPAAKDLA